MSDQKIIQNPAKMSKAIPKKKADKNANSIAYYTVIKIKKTNSTDSLDDFKLDPEKKIPLLEIREKYKKSKLSTKSVKDQNSPQSSVTSVSQNLPTYAGKKYDAQDNSNNNKVEKEKLEPVSKEDQERESAIQDLSFNWFLWDNQLKVLRTIDRRVRTESQFTVYFVLPLLRFILFPSFWLQRKTVGQGSHECRSQLKGYKYVLDFF